LSKRIYTRADWGAKGGRGDATVYGPHSAVFIHHSASPGGQKSFDAQAEHMREIERQHMAQGWDGIGYNYVVFQPFHRKLWHGARVFEGRGLGHIPAAQKGANSGTVAICVVGNFNGEEVKAGTLRRLVSLIKRMPGDRLRGHRDVNQTACPGNHLYAELPALRRRTGRDK
jgi:hypothetical protein